ncbi:Ig-like domain-containing protein [Mycobacterium sp. NPDC048908]|uniref:Ig-like domain-containing protein n=1 Tax=Mycobacterium sp. NPDC048908 TaxID=3364292 RepID=UPI00371DCCC0
MDVDTNTGSGDITATALTTATALVAPVTQVTSPVTTFVGVINNLFATLLNPFLAPAPATPGPFVPIAWAVLGWVRRNLFNEAPSIAYNPTLTSQTGQTVTGTLGATDPEGDPLTYTVAGANQVDSSTWTTDKGTLTIDQATGNFTYTPKDINYNAVQSESITVTVTDGKTNFLSLFGVPHSATTDTDVSVLNPQAERTIVNLPAGFTDAAIPRFAADGKSLLFSAAPPGGGGRRAPGDLSRRPRR